jgi:hypothetical protein
MIYQIIAVIGALAMFGFLLYVLWVVGKSLKQ